MTGEREDVMGVLRDVCAQVLTVPREHVVPGARLVADLGADSLDITELEVVLQETFGVRPEPAQVARVATVGDVADLVVALRGAPAAGGRTGGAVA